MRAALLLSLLALCACDIARAVDAGIALSGFIAHSFACQKEDAPKDCDD